MQDRNIFLPEDLYSEQLAIINGVKFTPREIEVISCLMSARGTSKIASFLTISPKTVVNHIRNIMLKLECNSREGIIDFIERSHKLHILRDHYSNLVTEKTFEKSLKEVSRLKHEGMPACLVIYWEDQKLKNALLGRLANHLTQGGINAEIRVQRLDQNADGVKNSTQVLLLLLEKQKGETPTAPTNLTFVDLFECKNYYLSVFDILKKLLPNINLEGIHANFWETAERLQGIARDKNPPEYKNNKYDNKDLRKAVRILIERKWHLVSAFLILGLLGVGFFIFKDRNEVTQNFSPILINQEKKEEPSIRSDLIVPTQSSLLHRPELLAQIDEKLIGQNGIQTVALVGPGGVGKTTLSRQYAHHQKTGVIWEINAETPESLRSSFESLAHALAKKEEDKKILRIIQGIKNFTEREEKIIQFVKKHLRSHKNWFLIFDNVEKFTDIQKQFPRDFETWGEGRIILTTRDGNIRSNAHVDDVILIAELSPDQKIDLFIKIMSHGNKLPLTPIQTEEIKAFLEYIPPFPLDVSVAAYYLKATHISYTTYLESLTKHDKDFESINEILLKEAGNYTKTRYKIITLSLQNIINTHKDFCDLLLFISLLDSQNIPRELLDQYKSKNIVDNFIYNLKKHSLITHETSQLSSLEMSFSIHRSTQAVMHKSLKRILTPQESKMLVHEISNCLINYIINLIEIEDISKMKCFLSHCNMILSYKDLITSPYQEFIQGELGFVYFHLSKYTKAKKILEAAIKDLTRFDLVKHFKIARFKGYLGIVERELGDYKKARDLLESSVLIYKETTPKDYSGLAQSLGYLGLLYRSLEDYVKAKDFLNESLLLYEKYFPENYIKIAWTLARLGNIYRLLNNYKKSEELLTKSLEIYNTHFPENHLRIPQVLGYLGLLEMDLHNYKKSQELFQKCYTISNTYFSENHINVAWALANLGVIEIKLGNPKKAKEFFEKSLSIYNQFFPKNHPEIQWALSLYNQIKNE